MRKMMERAAAASKQAAAPPKSTLLMDGHAAALELGVSRRTLERWRYLGQGPAYVKCGRLALYRREDLEAFIAANRVTPEAA